MRFKGLLLVVIVVLCGVSIADFEFEPDIRGKIIEYEFQLPE